MSTPLQTATFHPFRYDAMDKLREVPAGANANSARFYRAAELVNQTTAGSPGSYLRATNRLLAVRLGSVTQLPGPDRQGSPLLINDGAATSQLGYTAYGFNPAPVAIGFAGEAPDPVTGCYLLGNGYRAYDPVTMRFRSPDSFSPFGAGGINAYAYCKGDPINRSDVTGHFDWIRWVGIGATVLSFGAGLLTAKAALPAFDALLMKITGTTLLAREAATMTNASIAAAVAVSFSFASTATQVASAFVLAFADGDEAQVMNGRILGFASGLLGLASAVGSVVSSKFEARESLREITFIGQAPLASTQPSISSSPSVSLPRTPPSSPRQSPLRSPAAGPSSGLSRLDAPSPLSWGKAARQLGSPSNPNQSPQDRGIELREMPRRLQDWADLYDSIVNGQR